MTKILVIGYGNPLRSDDGAGIAVIEALHQHKLPDECVLLSQRQPYPETVAFMQEATHVVFVDASIGNTAGEIRCLPLGLPDPTGGNEIMTHHVTPEWLLGMAGKLYGHRPQGTLITITGGNFDIGEEFSDIVSKQLPHLVECVQAHIARLYNDGDDL